MPLSIPNFPVWLVSSNACQTAVDWVNGADFHTAWTTCARPDWMLWLLHQAMVQNLAGFPDRAEITSIANTAINLSTSSYKNELLMQVTFYSNQTDVKYVPMALNDDLFGRGAYGNISDVANSVRSAVSV
jgi:hypothetical protein